MMPGLAPPDAASIARARARWPGAFGSSPARRLARAGAALAVLLWLGALVWWFGITPARLAHGIAGVAVILRLMVPPAPGAQLADILRGLGESLAMALLGTLAAALLALPLGLLGARSILPSRLAHFGLRRVFDGLRGMDQLMWALAFVRAVGLGPLAGVLAIAAAEVAVLAKLYAEAIENADPRQSEAVRATGAGRLAVIRFGLLPQVLPVMLAQTLYAFESNTRSAAILGVVGAGGIGLQIAERIKVRYWNEVAFIILLILATVAVIDTLSGRLRRRLA